MKTGFQADYCESWKYIIDMIMVGHSPRASIAKFFDEHANLCIDAALVSQSKLLEFANTGKEADAIDTGTNTDDKDTDKKADAIDTDKKADATDPILKVKLETSGGLILSYDGFFSLASIRAEMNALGKSVLCTEPPSQATVCLFMKELEVIYCLCLFSIFWIVKNTQ